MRNNPTPAESLLEGALVDTGWIREIVLHNDDVNTFQHVIDCLVEICDHDELQAAQCTQIVHARGKYAVKHGSFDELAPRCNALQQRGLSVHIE